MQRPACASKTLVLIEEIKRSHTTGAYRAAIARDASFKGIVASHTLA